MEKELFDIDLDEHEPFGLEPPFEESDSFINGVEQVLDQAGFIRPDEQTNPFDLLSPSELNEMIEKTKNFEEQIERFETHTKSVTSTITQTQNYNKITVGNKSLILPKSGKRKLGRPKGTTKPEKSISKEKLNKKEIIKKIKDYYEEFGTTPPYKKAREILSHYPIVLQKMFGVETYSQVMKAAGIASKDDILNKINEFYDYYEFYPLFLDPIIFKDKVGVERKYVITNFGNIHNAIMEAGKRRGLTKEEIEKKIGTKIKVSKNRQIIELLKNYYQIYGRYPKKPSYKGGWTSKDFTEKVGVSFVSIKNKFGDLENAIEATKSGKMDETEEVLFNRTNEVAKKRIIENLKKYQQIYGTYPLKPSRIGEWTSKEFTKKVGVSFGTIKNIFGNLENAKEAVENAT